MSPTPQAPPPPPDPSTPGFYDDRGQMAIAPSFIFLTISLIAVAARLWTRIKIVKNPGKDDIAVVISWFCAATVNVLLCIQVSRGFGRHTDTLTLGQLAGILSPFWAEISIYQLSLNLAKVSILLQYLRIFVTKKTRFFCWAGLVIIALYTTYGILITIFMCRPVQFFWDKSIVDGYCMPAVPIWFSFAGMNIVTDVGILILPMPSLLKLQMPLRQKIGLMILLGIGGGVCIISILRLRGVYEVALSLDFSWDNVPVFIWTTGEANIGIICACVATYKPLLTRFFPSLFGPGSTKSSSARPMMAPGGFQKTPNGGSKPIPLSKPSRTFSRSGSSPLTGSTFSNESQYYEEKPYIQVTTRVDQEVGRHGQGDDGSQRKSTW